LKGKSIVIDDCRPGGKILYLDDGPALINESYGSRRVVDLAPLVETPGRPAWTASSSMAGPADNGIPGGRTTQFPAVRRQLYWMALACPIRSADNGILNGSLLIIKLRSQ